MSSRTMSVMGHRWTMAEVQYADEEQGLVACAGWVSDTVPGLVLACSTLVHAERFQKPADGYTVTHAASGKSVSGRLATKAAATVAAQLGALPIDWTTSDPAFVLALPKEVYAEVLAVLDARGVKSIAGPVTRTLPVGRVRLAEVLAIVKGAKPGDSVSCGPLVGRVKLPGSQATAMLNGFTDDAFVFGQVEALPPETPAERAKRGRAGPLPSDAWRATHTYQLRLGARRANGTASYATVQLAALRDGGAS